MSLPSRRSSPTGFPVTVGIAEHARAGRRASGTPRRGGCRTRSADPRARRRPPASAAPMCNGRSTVYLPDLYRSISSACARSRRAARRAREIEVLPDAQFDAQLVVQGAHVSGALENSWSAYTTKSPTRMAAPSPNRRASPRPPSVAMHRCERVVHRGFATSQRRAVHHVVVHEGERMQQLDAPRPRR